MTIIVHHNRGVVDSVATVEKGVFIIYEKRPLFRSLAINTE